MLRKFTLIAAATASTFVALPAAAQAQYGGYYGSRYDNNYRTDRYGRTYTYDRYGNRVYVNNGYYGRNSGAYYGRNSGAYYGNRNYNGGYSNYGRCSSGTTGTIVGGAVGALLGREIGRSGNRYSYGRGNGTTGAIIGGAVGALAGRAIDKGNCR